MSYIIVKSNTLQVACEKILLEIDVKNEKYNEKIAEFHEAGRKDFEKHVLDLFKESQNSFKFLKKFLRLKKKEPTKRNLREFKPNSSLSYNIRVYEQGDYFLGDTQDKVLRILEMCKISDKVQLDEHDVYCLRDYI